MFEKVNVAILGLIENMSYFSAPDGSRIEIFGHGGGRTEATRKGIPFLGEVPLFPSIREGGDRGIPVVAGAPQSPAGEAFLSIARELNRRLG
jgi:ATP-binding protein involved in chromosome partitioning